MTSTKKKLVSLFVAILLIAAVGIGTTLAYLYDVTGEKTNTFTYTGDGSEGGLKIAIQETQWEASGKAKAANLSFEDTYEKDPTVKNNSTSNAAYVALVMEITKDDEDETNLTIEELAQIATINNWSSDWTVVPVTEDGKTLYYCYYTADAVASGQSAPVLFDSITTLKSSNITETQEGGSKLFGFTITFTAYGAWSDGADNYWEAFDEANTALSWGLTLPQEPVTP